MRVRCGPVSLLAPAWRRKPSRPAPRGLWSARLADGDPLQCSETGRRQQEHPSREHERGGERQHADQGQRDDGGEYDRAEDRTDQRIDRRPPVEARNRLLRPTPVRTALKP